MPKLSKRIEAVKAHAWFVYILRCSDGSLYTGITTDVKRRSEQHNAGTAARYTRSRLPVRVEYQEPQASRSSALKREWAVKAMARLEKGSLIASTRPWLRRNDVSFPSFADVGQHHQGWNRLSPGVIVRRFLEASARNMAMV